MCKNNTEKKREERKERKRERKRRRKGKEEGKMASQGGTPPALWPGGGTLAVL